jgi:hypothetical protein
MSAVDGNAVAGLLRAAFGVEMTTALAECATCGTRGPLAETCAFLRGPGAVLRCRVCLHVAVVVTEIRGMHCVDLSGLRKVELPS